MWLTVAACFSPRYPEGSACTTECPGDLSCVSGRCIRSAAEGDAGTDAGADAGADAGIDAPAVCPPGYLQIPGTGSFYRVVNTPASQAAAVADCADDSARAYLAIPDNPIENNAIDSLANNDSWLGITDAVMEGTWVTVLGAPQTFFRWATGQPDGGTNENCAFIEDAVWQDVACMAGKPYVCECK